LRSETTKKILNETPEKLKQKATEYADNLIKNSMKNRITIQQAKELKEKYPDYKADKLWVNYYEGEPLMKWKLIDYLDRTPWFSSCEFPAPTIEEHDKLK